MFGSLCIMYTDLISDNNEMLMTIYSHALALLLMASSAVCFQAVAQNNNGHDALQDVVSPDTKVEIEAGQDKVFKAVQDGELRPFSELYATVDSQLEGRVIKVELEKNRQGWEYELKLENGEQVFEAKYDGGSLELLELEGRDLYNLIKPPVTP
jgi:uncharacterized membrane protein YkoI